MRPTWFSVDLDAVAHNIRAFRGLAAPAEVCMVVKADGYGHGAPAVAAAALEAGATWLAVALVEEAATLRDSGLTAPILVLSEPRPDEMSDVVGLGGVRPTLYSGAGVDAFASVADAGAPAHLKVDTGMGRLGVQAPDWPEFVESVAACSHIHVAGLFSHCSHADFPEESVTLGQQALFLDAAAQAEMAGLNPDTLHLANSAAALRFPQMRHDMVRVGIALYGVEPFPDCPVRLEPVMQVETEVLAVKKIPANTGVSYGGRWESDGPARIATLPVGYADGYLRALSGKAHVLIGGHRCPVRGSICMDLMMVDVSDCPVPVAKGTAVTLLGNDLSAAELADWAGTIPYEILTGFSGRIERSFQSLAKSV